MSEYFEYSVSRPEPVDQLAMLAVILSAVFFLLGSSSVWAGQPEPMVLVSVGPNGESLPTGGSNPAVSADGRYTAFGSQAPPAGTDISNDLSVSYVYLYDAGDQSLTVITAGIDGPPNGTSGQPDISADGRFVAFRSDASNLVNNDTNGFNDIFVFDRLDGSIARVSTNQFLSPADGENYDAQISDDGRHVSFRSSANNLDLNSMVLRSNPTLTVVDRDTDGNGIFDELGTLVATRLIPDSIPVSSIPENSNSYAMSADGRYLGFTSRLPGLTSTTGLADGRYLYFHDRDSDADGLFDEEMQTTTSLVSRTETGQAVTASGVYLSADGTTLSTQLSVPNGDQFLYQAVVIDLDPAETGTPDPSSAVTTVLRTYERSERSPRLSRSGQYAVLQGQSGGPRDGRDIDLLNRMTGQLTPISVGAFGRLANSTSYPGTPSNDGARVIFTSFASNLVALDSNGRSDVFLANVGQPPPPGPVPRECDDRVDNDADGDIDMDDSGCSAPNDNSESQLESPLVPINVTILGQRDASAVLLDSQGITGASPSLALSADGSSHVAYVREAYDSGLNRMRDFVRLATFDGIYWRSQTIDAGVSPSIASDDADTIHVAFHDPRDGDLRYATVNEAGTASMTIDSSGLTGLMPVMLLTQNDAPWVVYFDQDDSTIRLWRGVGNTQLDLVSGIEPCGMDASLTSNDDIEVVYVNCADDTIGYVSTIGQGITHETILAGFGYGAFLSLDHNNNDEPLFTYGSTVRAGMLFAKRVAGSWVSEELPDTENSFSAELLFLADGVTPSFVTNGETGLTYVVPNSSGFDSTPLGPQYAKATQFSAARGADGKIRAAYFDQDSGNLLHTTQDNNGWQFKTIAVTANGGARDLDFFNFEGGQPPTVVTFDSTLPGAIGELSVNTRKPYRGWEVSIPSAAAPQDEVDSRVVTPNPTLIRELAYFDNVDGELKYLIESAPDVWTSEFVVGVPRFGQIRNIRLFRVNNRPVIVGIVAADSENGTPDQPVAYLRQSPGIWSERRLAGSPANRIGQVAATQGPNQRIYMAYFDTALGDLRMATFDGQNWADEAVDFGGINIFDRAVAITTTVEQLRNRPTVVVPVIAYLNAANDRLRVASRVARWQTFEYQDAVPGIDKLSMALEGDSRQRPMILASNFNGDLMLYRQAGNGIRQSERETVASDYSRSGSIHLELKPTPAVVYTNSAGETLYALGSALPGLPTARQGDQPGASSVTVDLCAAILGGSSKFNLPRSKAEGAADDESTLARWEAQFSRTSDGQRYIDFFRRDFPKAFRIIAADPGLLVDANTALQNFFPGIQAMVEGQGSAVVITQEMIDGGRDIWERLSDRDSGSLSAFIELELARWNQLEDFVGMTFEEWAITIGVDPTGTPLTNDIFMDSFEAPKLKGAGSSATVDQ